MITYKEVCPKCGKAYRGQNKNRVQELYNAHKETHLVTSAKRRHPSGLGWY